MPRDERHAEVDAWLARASEDVRAARVDLAEEPPLLGDAAFHCQQAVEKAMKGLFVWDAEPFGKTHDLRALGDVLSTRHPELQAHVDDVAALTEYAWRFRYPGDVADPPEEEVCEALGAARKFLAAVRDICLEAS